jgi:hypothetical protein
MIGFCLRIDWHQKKEQSLTAVWTSDCFFRHQALIEIGILVEEKKFDS